MNDVLKASLLKKQLPAFVNDTLGNAFYGPSLKSQDNDNIAIDGRSYNIDKLMERCTANDDAKALTRELVDAVSKADPRKLYRLKNAGFIARLWNGLTGGLDSNIIEFDLYCLRVEKLITRIPPMTQELQDVIHLITTLRDIYQRDSESLEQYIQAGDEYLNEEMGRIEEKTESVEYGLNRLRKRLVNLRVLKSSMDMHTTTVNMSLYSTLAINESMTDFVNGLLPMWQQQIKMLKSGMYDVSADTETEKNFRALVNKINASMD